MDLIIAFVLGAGTVVAGKRGTRLLRDAMGWTARKTGHFSKHASIALARARRMARQEFTRGRDSSEPIIVDITDPSVEGDEITQELTQNGASAPSTGFVP